MSSTIQPYWQDFVDNIKNLNLGIPAPPITGIPGSTLFATTNTALENYLGNVNNVNTAFFGMTNIKSSDDFFTYLADFHDHHLIGPTPPGTLQQVKDAFIYDYSNAVHVSEDAWTHLSPQFDVQFNSWFDTFIKTFPTQPPIPNGIFGGKINFYNEASTQLTTTALLDNATAPVTFIPRYEEVYNAYFGDPANSGPTRQQFINYLNSFYNDQVNANGFFIPSQSFAAFVNKVQYDYTQSLGPTLINPGQSNLAPADFNLTAILDRIYALIKDMLQSMQNIAAVQANRLTVLTNWQQAYTTELSQLKNFLKEDKDVLYPGYLSDQNFTDLNEKVNQLRQLVTTNQSVVSDDAKSLQSSINQSTDAVTQQANMATSIIQELSTLLSAIYR